MSGRAFVLDFREADVGGAIVGPVLSDARGALLALGDLRALARPSEHVVVLVHGFNVSRREGRRALLALEARLEGLVDAIFLAVLWPGDDRLSPLTYSFEERDADRTARRLAAVLARSLASSTRISLVAHSLGCRVALETMRELRARARGAHEVVLMAGAVDCDALARDDRYRAAVEAASRVHWLASTHDRVLQFAFPMGDAVAALLFGGYTKTALGRRGPRAQGAREVPRDVSGRQLDEHRVGHGDYLPSPRPNELQERAARFVAGALRGDAPSYE